MLDVLFIVIIENAFVSIAEILFKTTTWVIPHFRSLVVETRKIDGLCKVKKLSLKAICIEQVKLRVLPTPDNKKTNVISGNCSRTCRFSYSCSNVTALELSIDMHVANEKWKKWKKGKYCIISLSLILKQRRREGSGVVRCERTLFDRQENERLL